MKTARFYFPGIALLIIAYLVLLFPEVIIALASGAITIAGFFALYIGHKIRLFQSAAGTFEQRPFNSNFHKMSYAKVWSKHNR